jgi:hypothetical protein
MKFNRYTRYLASLDNRPSQRTTEDLADEVFAAYYYFVAGKRTKFEKKIATLKKKKSVNIGGDHANLAELDNLYKQLRGLPSFKSYTIEEYNEANVFLAEEDQTRHDPNIRRRVVLVEPDTLNTIVVIVHLPTKPRKEE